VDLSAGNATLHDNPTPLSVSRFCLWQEKELLFDELETPVSLADVQSQTIPFTRTRAHVPEFRRILERVEKSCSFRDQTPDR
jgi:hypothetical protein